MPEAIETFRHSRPTTLAQCKSIEEVSASALRKTLEIQKGDLDVLVGGPPCQGFSINAPSRFLNDPRKQFIQALRTICRGVFTESIRF
jgi:DNA (cytosine-5)-methyltransferase 1